MRDDDSKFGAEDYRFTTLEPNQIFVEDGQMDEEQWSHLAFSLGVPTRESGSPTTESKRFVQKLKQRKKDTNVRIDDLLEGLLEPICAAHSKVELKINSPFWRDAVPCGVKDEKVESGWQEQLPTPKPAFTIGYRNEAFRKRYYELQNGIIRNEQSEPCNLAQVSQPIPDVYWPFLVVDVRPRAQLGSMRSAKYALAGAAATCNNAIMMLSNAAQRPNEYSTSPTLQWDTAKLAQCFSLAVDGQIACLSSHNSQGVLPHSMVGVRSYRLEEEKEVQELCARLESIMVWAENCRLVTLGEVLDRLDRRVHMGVPSQTPCKAEFDEVIWQERFGDKRTRMRSTFWDRFPSLSRVLRVKPVASVQ